MQLGALSRVAFLALSRVAFLALSRVAFLVPALVAFLAPALAQAAPAERCIDKTPGRLVGYVVDVSGVVSAGDPECPDTLRPVVCGELLLDGELLETSETGRAELLSFGQRVAVEAGSVLQLGLTAAGEPSLETVRGRVRVLAPDDSLPAEASDTCPDAIGDARNRFNPADVAAAGGSGFPPPGSGSGPGLEPCEVGGSCGGPLPPILPPVVPPVVPPDPPKPPPVVESPPVFRPPPGLPVRPRP